MPQDFFAQGFGQQQGPVFTKEENQFFQKKVGFLDPRHTYQISIGNVLALLKYTKLDNQTIKKIINNSCVNGIGQKTITYDEMKKIFRGVALKQNKIEPSKINIEANIKTKMPIFYDDDESEGEEQEQQKPPPQPKFQAKQSQPPKPPVQTPQSHNQPVNQLPQPPKPQQQAPVNPLKAFDEYWKTLKTKNNLIDGSEVKKMFTGNNANKNNLSKAWKLCNISEKGVLTKGQFFIFMNLIHSPNIPQALTKEMKDLIKQIQDACGYKKVTGQSSQSSTQPTSQKSTPTPTQKRSSSDAFDRFGDESLFMKNNSKVQDLSKSGMIQKSSPNVFSAPPTTLPSSSILSPPPTQSSTSNKNPLQLLQKVQNVGKQQKYREKQISNISKNNQQMMQGLESIEQYLQIVEENFSITTTKIQSLKQTQNALNQRLNNVCLKFKNIITKQSECIAFLMETMKVDSQANTQRLEILQGYTEQMIQFVDSNVEISKNQVNQLQKQQSQAYEGLRHQNQQLREKLSAGNVSSRSPQQITKAPESINSFKNSPQFGQNSRVDPFEDNQVDQGNDNQEPNIGYQQGNTEKNNEQQGGQYRQQTNNFAVQSNNQSHHSQQQQSQQQQGHMFLQNLSPQERKKTKQMLLIQILNSVSSMNQEQYQVVVAKVVAMTQEQMNQSYTKLYALYMQNVAKSGIAPRYPVPTPQQFTASYG